MSDPSSEGRRWAPGSAPAARALAVVLALGVGGFVAGLATSTPQPRLPGASVDLAADYDGLVQTETSIPGRVGTVRVLSESVSREPTAVTAALDATAPLQARDDVPATGGLTDLIRRYFGNRTVEAIVIVQCESGFRPDAVGTNTNGTQDHGLFQINDVHRATFEAVLGRSWDERYDPEVNTAFAAWLHAHADGWGPWRCNDRLAEFDVAPDGE